MSQPESLLPDLQAERAKYGATMTDDECVELCNAVAWKNRAEGWGLNQKTSGTHGERYDGQGCAHDILHHQPTNGLYDVLIAAGAASTPTWGYLGTNQNSSRPWVAPIIPENGEGNGNGGNGNGNGGNVELPAYESPQVGGDNGGWKIGNYLFYDYERAGQAPNPGMGVWFYRTSYDCIAGLNFEESLAKHRAEWCQALGIPVDNKEF